MCYQDFLGEAISENYRTGKLKKPNKNNKIFKARSAFQTKLKKDAEQQNRPIESVALDYVQANSGQLQKYIMSKGELPMDENPENLAVQAWNLRKVEVENIANALGSDFQTAEAYLDDAENRAMEINSPDSDSFIGEIIDIIGKAASPALKKAAEKRQAAGKKPGFAGTLAGIFGNPVDELKPESQDPKVLSQIYEGIVAQQKKEEIKKMLPTIIIGVVALIIVVVLITRKASK